MNRLGFSVIATLSILIGFSTQPAEAFLGRAATQSAAKGAVAKGAASNAAKGSVAAAERGSVRAAGKPVTGSPPTRATAQGSARKNIAPHHLEGHALGKSVAETFRGGIYRQRRLETPLTVYRYHGHGNHHKDLSHAYLTTDVYPSEVMARRHLALPIMPSGNKRGYQHTRVVTTYELPPGTLISEGYVGQLKTRTGNMHPGGGHQIYLQRLSPNWVVKRDNRVLNDQKIGEFYREQHLARTARGEKPAPGGIYFTNLDRH